MTVQKTVLKWVIATLVLAFAQLSILTDGPAHAQLNREVSNIATVSYEADGNEGLRFNTNEAVFVIEARRTPSVIEFFRYAPTANSPLMTQIYGSDYSPTGSVPAMGAASADPFLPIGPATTSGGQVISTAGPLPLIPAERYLSGELMFVRLIDTGQNGNPNVIETVVVVVTSDAGDEITLRLYESGPNTGEFFAYIPTTSDATNMHDAVLTAPGNSTLTATYQDLFDATEVSVDTALVDPIGRVFDSLTGQMIDGVPVTIIDVATGQPADVLGVDGFSTYPSTVITGATVTDSAGLEYIQESGEFLFPVLQPGEYRLELGVPEGYLFPSSFSDSDLNDLETAPFDIISASYGGSFVVTATGPFNFDVPLDPAGELVLTKSTTTATAAVGDTVAYIVEVTNRDVVPAPVSIIDTLPYGVRFADGSASMDGGDVSLTGVSEDGRTLRFDGSPVLPGDTIRISYAATVAANAHLGTAINTAVAVNTAGNPISNRAEAAIEIIEDLLRSRLTIVGRVAEEACDGDEDWARELVDGIGVSGVRLYMETGEYVVTDEDGLYHFEGVTTGTHVVQIDEATLPAGYEVMTCEENSRYAGSATSKFVDAIGGSIWRADFYLARTGEVEVAETIEEFDDHTEYLQYGEEWLKTADATPRWVYPETARTPSSRSVNIGIVHQKRQRVRLYLNGGQEIRANFVGQDEHPDGEAQISRWRGVDIQSGENKFVAEIMTPNGEVVDRLEETIWFVERVEKAHLVADQSELIADGISNPVLAIRLEDSGGRPIHKGRVVRVDVSEPHTLRLRNQFESSSVLTALSNDTGVSAGPDGIARVELEPTLETGRVRVTINLDNGRVEEIDAYLKPEKRDWIVVGLAEGMASLEQLDGAQGNGQDTISDGRVALFAKGMVKGDWLLTLALDTSKRRGNRDDQLFDGQIDPNAYYTLYGDRTYQNSDAQSRYPFYVKLEKDAVQLLFGDYATELDNTVLGRYSRNLSGLKGVYDGRNVSATGFAAETNQGFAKDEIAADGTTGIYLLSEAPVVRNSEIVTIETRDRVRPDRIVSSRTMKRYYDYEIDFTTGEILFRHPVAVSDENFNPNVIVVDYERVADTERNVTAGGRLAIHTTDRRLEAGVTYIHEEGSSTGANAESDLIGVDATARLSEATELRAEVASSDANSNIGDASGAAYLLEATHQAERVQANAYYREEEAGFGVGQQGSNSSGLRRFGADVKAQVSETDGQRRERLVRASAYREESLSDGSSRDVAEVSLAQESANLGLAAGLKAVKEKYSDENRESVLATASVRKRVPELGLNLIASHEQPLVSDGDETTLFPQRTTIGMDKDLNEWATLNARHEINNGENASGQNSVVGITTRPWMGGEVRASADMMTQDSAQRVGSTVSVDQTIAINEKWTASGGLARRSYINSNDDNRDVTADDALSPFEDGVRSQLVQDEAYKSAHIGLGYQDVNEAASARTEVRDSTLGNRWSVTVGGAREISEKFSYALAGRYQNETRSDVPNSRRGEIRLGTSWRPRGEGMIVFDRLDLKHENISGQSDVSKIVNNLGVNTMVTDQTQMSVNWGIKYQDSKVSNIKTSGVTQLIGTEVRHDVTERIDVGVSGSALIDHTTNTMDYSFGPSVGISPVDNVWASVGYNFSGYEDEDFVAAEYNRHGLYIKIRAKFDQHTAEGFLKSISPDER